MIESPDSWHAILLRFAVATGLAGIIGLEREQRGHDAGLRTNMLVALGAALFVLIGLRMVEELRELEGVRIDATRVLTGLVGGVGFLGAGAILQSRGEIRGLTTAAGIWVCAAIGASAGLGMYLLAALGAGAAIVVLAVLRFVERYIPSKDRRPIPAAESDETKNEP